MPLNLLIVGQTERAEAKPLVEWLSAALRPAEQRQFSDLTLALDVASRANAIPDLIVIVQSQPDEFAPTEIASLFAFAPLARVVVAYGGWCESDGRNRSLWPLAARVSMSNAAARIEREWQLLHAAIGIEALPLSASREEVFAHDHCLLKQTSSPQNVFVVSSDPAYRRFLKELLAAAGHTVNASDRTDSHLLPTAILFDADPWDDMRLGQVRSLRQQYPSSKIIALLSASHPQHEAELIAAGAFAVKSKLGDQATIVSAI